MKHSTITVGELRLHLKPFGDNWDLFFGNGNLEFYRTKARGESTVQIEFNQHTDLASEERWVAVEQDRPTIPDTVAIICRQRDGGLLRMTGYFNEGRWGIIGNRDDLNIIEVTHWYYLPDSIPDFRRGDPV